MDQRFQQQLWPAAIQTRIPKRRRLYACAGVIGRTVGTALGPNGASSVASANAESCNGERAVAALATVGQAANSESAATSGNGPTGDGIGASARSVQHCVGGGAATQERPKDSW